MPTSVVFSPEMESRVRFVEDTPPAEIIERTLSMLRGGEAPEQLLAAAALAVSRSTEIPSNHHGDSDLANNRRPYRISQLHHNSQGSWLRSSAY